MRSNLDYGAMAAAQMSEVWGRHANDSSIVSVPLTNLDRKLLCVETGDTIRTTLPALFGFPGRVL